MGRPRLLWRWLRARLRGIARENIVSDPLPCDLPQYVLEPLPVSPNSAVGILPLIVAESLLVKIAEEVERFNANVCPLDAPLQQAPVVLQSVRVASAPNVLYRMVYGFVDVIRFQSFVALQGVGVQTRTDFHVRPNLRVQGALFRVFKNLRADFATAF